MPQKCFVLMPFKEPFNSYYKQIFVPSIEAAGYSPIRADEIYGTGVIMDDVINEIRDAEALVADITEKNPNVNYEMGIAHTLLKPVVIISQTIDDIPFDYRHLRAIIYDIQETDWQSNLKDKITKTLQKLSLDTQKRKPDISADKLPHKPLQIQNERHANDLTYKISPQKPHQGTVILSVEDQNGNPIKSAQVLLISKNTTYLEAVSGLDGSTSFSNVKKQPLTVFCAHRDYRASILRKFDGDSLTIKLDKGRNIGSIICPNGTGYVPGLEGRLNPILDNLNRLYLYAENISIEDGIQQPVTLTLSEPFKVEDKYGNVFSLTIIEAIGKSFLIEFERIETTDSTPD
jgi:hypothetical protein